MRYPLYALGSALAFAIIGCGSGVSSGTLSSVLVSDAYVVNATVESGDATAYEDIQRGRGWYQFEVPISEEIHVTDGVNDINPTNGIADRGEPFAPLLKAPSYYQNINPFTTMRQLDETSMQERYPNAYAYDSSFNFDVVEASNQNFSIAQENAKAAIELSAMNAPKRVVNLRIINGEKVQESDPTWRFIVSLQFNNDHSCGGALIDSEWVITAAHCITNFHGKPLRTFPTTLAGTYSLVIGGIKVEADALYPHENYDTDTVNNDIGLIHLKTPLHNTPPIALNHDVPQDESMTKVAGWGNTLIHGSHYPDDLMQVSLPIINFDTCNDSYYSLTDNMFCAGYMNGSKDSCQGDSGGPLIQNNKLTGIVSFGGSDTQACGAPDFPGVYTKVANYIEWIESHTGPLSSSSSSSSSSAPTLEGIFKEIDDAQDHNELNAIIIEYMGYYNGVYSE